MSPTHSITEYLKGANEELRKVVWPTKEETVRSTIIVIAMSAVVALFFWLLDLVFNYLLSFIVK